MKHEETFLGWPDKLDINELASRIDLRIMIEPKPNPVEVQTDCKIKQDDAAHRLRKDWLLFRIGIFAWLAFGALCIALVLKGPTATDRSWAFAMLTAMITGLLGYLWGRRQPAS